MNTQQLAEILEQQRKLKSIEEQILKQIEQVNQTINYLTVEEFQLQTCEIEQKTDIDLKMERNSNPPPVIQIPKLEELLEPEVINKQTIDLELNEFQNAVNYEIEEDEEEYY